MRSICQGQCICCCCHKHRCRGSLCNLRLADNTSSAALSCNSAVATLPWLLLSLSLPWLNVGWLLFIDLFFLAALHHDAINDDAAFIIASFLSIHHFASLQSSSVNLLCCTKALMLLTCLHQCRRLIVVYFVNFLSFCATGHRSLTLVANPRHRIQCCKKPQPCTQFRAFKTLPLPNQCLNHCLEINLQRYCHCPLLSHIPLTDQKPLRHSHCPCQYQPFVKLEPDRQRRSRICRGHFSLRCNEVLLNALSPPAQLRHHLLGCGMASADAVSAVAYGWFVDCYISPHWFTMAVFYHSLCMAASWRHLYRCILPLPSLQLLVPMICVADTKVNTSRKTRICNDISVEAVKNVKFT